MIYLTPMERNALLILFKDFSSYYNANSISKILNISHVGAQKLFKRLLKDEILVCKKIGKSIIYKLRLEDENVRRLIAFLLASESDNFKRWKEEFKELNKNNWIVIMYGSAIKNYDKAQDIDIMVILEKKDVNEVNRILKEKGEILPKKLHPIKLTFHDLLENLKNKNKATIEIIKSAVVLYGQDKYVEIIKNVTGI